MQNSPDYLLQNKVVELFNLYNKVISDLKKDCVRSRPTYIFWYTSMIEDYSKIVKVLKDYLDSHNLLALAKGLKEIGSVADLVNLKQFIHDQDVLKVICAAEEEEKNRFRVNEL